MHLTRGAVVLEDADVVDAVPRFAPIADPPHGSVLPSTITASSESARDTHSADDRSHMIRCPEIYRPFGSTAPTWIRAYWQLLQPGSLNVLDHAIATCFAVSQVVQGDGADDA